MTISPDLPGFPDVDVTGLDPTVPEDMATIGVAHGMELMPEWEPLKGDVGVTLIEQFAAMGAPWVERAENAPALMMEQILEVSGCPRDFGRGARVTVEATFSDGLGHSIPAGTTIIVGSTVMTLDGPLAAITPATTATANATASTPGVVQGLSTSTPARLLDAVGYINTLAVTAVLAAGAAPETDDDYLQRASAWQLAMTQAIGRPVQLAWRALADPRVGRALAVQRWDGDDPETIGDDLGKMHLLLLDRDAEELAEDDATDLQVTLQGLMLGDVELTLGTPTVTTVDVEAALTLMPGYGSAAVIDAVKAAIRKYLDKTVWPFGAALRLTRLLQVIETVPGVDGATITAPASDVEPDAIELLTAGDLAITVP